MFVCFVGFFEGGEGVTDARWILMRLSQHKGMKQQNEASNSLKELLSHYLVLHG